MQQLVKISTELALATKVESIRDCIRRIMVYFMLSYFLNECALEFGFRYKKVLEDWNEKMFPSLEAFIWADRECRQAVN